MAADGFWRIAAFLVFFPAAVPLVAETTHTFKSTNSTGVPNLIEESRSVSVINESSIQREPDANRTLFGVFASAISAQRLEIFALDKTVRYQETSRRPALGVQWAEMPLHYYGYWGFTASLQYSYFENRSSRTNTALHWTGADLGLIYRYENDPKSIFKPFAAVLGGSQIFVQRGSARDNTSEARGHGTLAAGTALNMNRILKMNSPLLWETQVQWKRLLAPSDSRIDVRGDHFALAMQLAL